MNSQKKVGKLKTLEVMEVVMKAKRLSLRTQRNYEQAFRSLAAYSEEWPESCVVIDGWTASLVNLQDSTVRERFSVIAASAKYMKKVYKLPNPCEDAERPKVKKKRRRYFSSSEIVAIIKACVSEYELLLVLTLVDSACRVGELAGLRGRDVGNGFINVAGKTGQRRYRLNEALCERLRKFAGGDDLPVFKHRSGGFHVGGSALSMHVRRIAERGGISGVRLGAHTLRHSSASLLAAETGQALIVKALLQHDDIEMSMRYIHDVEDMVVGNEQYSPLRILGKKYAEDVAYGGAEQLQLKGEVEDGQAVSTAVVPYGVGGLVEVEGASLVGDLFPEVESGIAVRTVLREDDLKLLRKICVFYARYNDGNDVSRARVLMRRMLRKGGSKFYAKG